MKYPKPNIGDTIYIVPTWGSNCGDKPHEEIVTAVGRVYFNFGTSRVKMDTWEVDRGNFGSVEQAHPSKECYDALQRRKALWEGICAQRGYELLTESELAELLNRLS